MTQAGPGMQASGRPRLVHWLAALLILLALRMIVPVIAIFY